MNMQQKVIQNKLGVLKLAEKLGSVSQACKIAEWVDSHPTRESNKRQ